jgi:hypothetical protein
VETHGPNGESPYELRQDANNREYCRAYQEWLANLTPEDLERIRQIELDQPLVDYHTWRPDSSSALTVAPAAAQPEPEKVSTETTGNLDGSEALARLVLRVVDSPKPRYLCDALAVAFGLYARMGITGTAIAAKHGVCRAAFSKAVKEIQEEFGIAPSRPMKSKKACETYRLTNGQTPTGATIRASRSRCPPHRKP